MDGNVRKAVEDGRGSYIPVFLSEVPTLFRKGIVPIDVALISFSPPDQHGYCSLGASVDTRRAAEECAKYVIALVNQYILLERMEMVLFIWPHRRHGGMQ